MPNRLAQRPLELGRSLGLTMRTTVAAAILLMLVFVPRAGWSQPTIPKMEELSVFGAASLLTPAGPSGRDVISRADGYSPLRGGIGVEALWHGQWDDWIGGIGFAWETYDVRADVGGRRLVGSLRTLPSITGYGYYETCGATAGDCDSALYVGLGLAFLQLRDGRLYEPVVASDGAVLGRAASVSGDSIGAQLLVGYQHEWVMLELGYQARYFPSLAWANVPSGWAGYPEWAYLGGLFARLGIVVDFDDKPAEPKKE